MGLIGFAADKSTRLSSKGQSDLAPPIGDLGQGERAKVLNARLQAVKTGGDYAVTLKGETQ